MAELCEHATERRGAEVFWKTHAEMIIIQP